MLKGEFPHGLYLKEPALTNLINGVWFHVLQITGIYLVTRIRNIGCPRIAAGGRDPVEMGKTARLGNDHPLCRGGCFLRSVDQPEWVIVTVHAAVGDEFGRARYAAYLPAGYAVDGDPTAFIKTTVACQTTRMAGFRQAGDWIGTGIDDIELSEQFLRISGVVVIT